MKIKNIPFVHGGQYLSSNLESILQIGLNPKGRNIKEIDIAAGNGNCISLRLARVHANFGSGEILVIDPDVSDLPGVRFYTRELYGIGNDIRRYLTGSGFEQPDSILHKELLNKIISSEREKTVSRGLSTSGNDLFAKLTRSPEFREYLSAYALSKNDFYKKFEKKCSLIGCTLQEFFERYPYSNEWQINEDICIPEVVQPNFLLGYWDGNDFRNFGRILPAPRQEIFEEFVQSLKNAKTFKK